MKHTFSHRLLPAILLVGISLVCGCQKVYYGTMEKLGHPKRDILVDRVADARDTQNEAKEQFASALEQFMSVVNVQGGDLQKKYDTLNAEYKKSEKKAEAVRTRIKDIKNVAEALFYEWEDELDEYTNDTYRQASKQKLEQTKTLYGNLIGAMERAESKMEPVLNAFRDQVLFLKHNLNAQAIASLQNELTTVENDIGILIREMEKSIDEANAFIQEMTQQDA
jgi:hypothetical protein